MLDPKHQVQLSTAGDTELRGLVARTGATAVDRSGMGWVHYAVLADRADLIPLLVSIGCSVSTQDSQGFSPLHLAASAGSLKMVDQLLAAGSSVDCADKYGNTPLSKAVFQCDGVSGACIQALLRAGADPDRKNSMGVSPRSLAAKIANRDVRQFLP